MGRIVGIDLGTTYSAIAIPEARSGEGFSAIRECPGHSLILDRFKNRIHPSVVAEDANGEITVGHRAKNRAGYAPEPIMFSKRYMGEDVKFTLKKQGELTPTDVATHILRYLKSVAEERLGEPVDQAVITVPAYFPLRAKQMTEAAGERAGLRVAQIAQEPVAAALMYCLGDTRDPLRIMTYDLGGGTFDVAIVEKLDGTISTNSIRAFDGNRFLGGYNFDEKLAKWLMKELTSRNYDLELDLSVPGDRVIFAKLMISAERAKIELSRADAYTILEQNTGIVDHSGNPVSIDITIARDQFEAMIAPQIDETIDLCRRAFEKTDPTIRPDQIDEIVMVGGSSRIPLVSQRLEEAFGRKPKLVEPDLCVALGAAILAGTMGKTYGRLKLDPVPAETSLDRLTITGGILAGDGLVTLEGCGVQLRSADGSYNVRRTTARDGQFAFDGVPLVPESANDFMLTARSPAGADIVSHRFTVKHAESARAGALVEPVTNILSKPIGVRTVEGITVLAPERTPLPYEVVKRAATSDTSGGIRIPIVEGNSEMGEIVMSGIPTMVAVGSDVEITLSIQANYQIRGRAYVPAIGRDASVVIDIPIPPFKTVEELRREYEMLAEQAEMALKSAPPGELFIKGTRLKKRMREVEELLASRPPEPPRIQETLDDLNALIRELSRGWQPDPPKAVFDQKAEEAEELLAAAIKAKPKVADDGYDRELAAIRAEAVKAYTTQHGGAWKESFDKVSDLCDRLEQLLPPVGPPPEQSPESLLLICGQEFDALQKWAKKERPQVYQRLAGEFEAVAEALRQIDPRSADFGLQLRDWYMTKFASLKKAVDAPESEGLVKFEQAAR